MAKPAISISPAACADLFGSECQVVPAQLSIWCSAYSSRHALPITPNHLDRQFASDRANRHWVSHMIYVRTAQGWLYLAVVPGLYLRAVVGWAMHQRMQQALIHAAREMA